MIESIVKSKVSSDRVWQAWSKAHAMESGFAPGRKGALKTRGKSSISYKILEVREGKSFSILWKSLFVRLIFTHSVVPVAQGSEICYQVKIKGFFAWPLRYFLKEKLRTNLNAVLKSLVRELEAG